MYCLQLDAFTNTTARKWTRISILYESQKVSVLRKLHGSSGAPTAFQNSLREINELVNEQRDLTQLSEPLANSVLGYTLNGLSPDSNVTIVLPHDLEKTIDLDRIDGLARETLQTRQLIPDVVPPNKQVLENQSWNFSEPRFDERQAGNAFDSRLSFTSGFNAPGIDWLQWNMIDFQDTIPADLNILNFDPNM